MAPKKSKGYKSVPGQTPNENFIHAIYRQRYRVKQRKLKRIQKELTILLRDIGYRLSKLRKDIRETSGSDQSSSSDEEIIEKMQRNIEKDKDDRVQKFMAQMDDLLRDSSSEGVVGAHGSYVARGGDIEEDFHQENSDCMTKAKAKTKMQTKAEAKVEENLPAPAALPARRTPPRKK